MSAPLGNKFWQARSSHGRKPIFETPEELWSACEEYFEWVQANPIRSHKQYCHQGILVNGVQAHMRAMSVSGLCIFLGIARETWNNYSTRNAENDEDFLVVTRRAREIIDTQKFEGAACGVLSANIIARDLGLKDANTHEHSGNIGTVVASVTETIVDPNDAE